MKTPTSAVFALELLGLWKGLMQQDAMFQVARYPEDTRCLNEDAAYFVRYLNHKYSTVYAPECKREGNLLGCILDGEVYTVELLSSEVKDENSL